MRKDATQTPQPDTAQGRVDRTCHALALLLGRLEAVELLRSLIERIVIAPHEKGHEIELVGDIVKLLELPCGEGVVADPFARSAKVVAGARSHRDYKSVRAIV